MNERRSLQSKNLHNLEIVFSAHSRNPEIACQSSDRVA